MISRLPGCCRRLCGFLVFAVATGLLAQTPPSALEPKTSPAMAASMQKDGVLLSIRWDAGKVFLGVPLTEKGGTSSPEYILADTLASAVGENDLQMDRGQIGIQGDGILRPDSRLVFFARMGSKLLLVQENTKFRTSAPDSSQQLAVQQSFPSSILAGFDIAEAGDGFVVVDATDYFLQDIQAAGEVLSAKKQGTYKVDLKRSMLVPENSKAFPDNTEVEALLTMVTDEPNQATILAEVAPDVRAVTLRERHIFLKLPPPGFVPRRYSPRSGYGNVTYREMNTPLGVDVDQQFISRHRLQKLDPACARDCTAIRPIKYYVDRGAPEPLRDALVEGCSWWDDAFQAAGWAKGTFQVELLPPGADPMDARYNIIQWVHRANRGWSFGDAITDPRTGEILKGNVTLGSLRGRQDYLLAEALLAPYKDGKLPANDEALAMVLARIRQLAAHETGHTLGLMHNFAASSMPHSPETTVSVMDYPPPFITLDKNGLPDVSHAYSLGIGEWDKVAIDYGYREFDRDGRSIEDTDALEAILHSAEVRGLPYLSDADARPRGSASPIAHLWDGGTDAASELNRILDVRRAALQRFGENTIRPGTPMAQMEDTLAPLYLLHRYQTEAATKMIGGLDYRYTVRGDGQKAPQIVAAEEQRRALVAVVKTLSPEVLTLPESLLRQFPPRTPGMRQTVDGGASVESLVSNTSVTFDPIGAAESAADLTLTILFDAARANRLCEYHARDASDPTLEEVIASALRAADSVPAGSELAKLVSKAIKARIVEALFRLAIDPQTSFAVRSAVRAQLHAFAQAQPASVDGKEIRRRIAAFESAPEKFEPQPLLKAPPGSPIGDDEAF